MTHVLILGADDSLLKLVLSIIFDEIIKINKKIILNSLILLD
jgi:hypothetical protein